MKSSHVNIYFTCIPMVEPCILAPGNANTSLMWLLMSGMDCIAHEPCYAQYQTAPTAVSSSRICMRREGLPALFWVHVYRSLPADNQMAKRKQRHHTLSHQIDFSFWILVSNSGYLSKANSIADVLAWLNSKRHVNWPALGTVWVDPNAWRHIYPGSKRYRQFPEWEVSGIESR